VVVNEPARNSIFLSYSRVDRAFVDGLVRSMKRAGIDVSYDEMESLRVGDRLSRRLKAAIDRHDYLAVVLSPHSVASDWVNRELKWAIEEEESSGRDKILPLIAHECVIPDFLADRKRADMSTSALRNAGLIDLISKLGGDAISATAELYPLLGALRTEAIGDGVSHSTIDAVAAATTPTAVLEPFLSELVDDASPNGLLALAEIAMKLVDSKGTCHAVAEAAIAHPTFPDHGGQSLAAISTELTSAEAITWWHDLFVERFHDDVYYHTLLQSHAPTLLAERYDEVAAYSSSRTAGPPTTTSIRCWKSSRTRTHRVHSLSVGDGGS
jgi:hypothetical protein